MKSTLKKIFLFLDDTLLRVVVKSIYPQYKRPRRGYVLNYFILKRYLFWQKILGINRKVQWPVHFTSIINSPHNITKGICSDPGDNLGIYINAGGGLTIGNNVNIGQNTTITTTNHYKYDHRKLGFKKGIIIGDNVWVGANCCIIAGVTIGDNVTIGAGCVIRKDIPDNCTVMGSDDSIQIIEKTKPYEWDCTKEELL